jgi:NitT/TauT family transport system ATP-binding protein
MQRARKVGKGSRGVAILGAAHKKPPCACSDADVGPCGSNVAIKLQRRASFALPPACSEARKDLQMMQNRRGAAVAIAGLRKEYGEGPKRVIALDGIDLAVPPGEFCCIVGPSGCGKSTLLRILAGLDRATSGTIEVNAAGWPVANAMVFQESGLFPWMTVEKNVGFGLMTRGVAPADATKRVEAALRLVGLPRFRHHYPHQLSGGMRQRGAIARAFVTDPGMLLMDEPFAALDAQNRIILQAELVRIWEETGKTVIYITHSIDEALLLGDRAVVMTAQPGRIKEIIGIPFPHPRNVMELSATPEFGALRLAIWHILEDEVMRARSEMESEME